MKKIFTALLMTSIFSFSSFSQNFSVDLTQKPVTNGFADMGKLQYSYKKVILIDDATYPDPIKKRQAFTSAIGRGKALVILSGDVDLSDGKISDTDHSYFDAFGSGHGRLHNDIIYTVSSNTTIIGKDNARVMFGGLYIPTGNNIIIQNITFWDAHGSTEMDTNFSPDSKASQDALVLWDKSSAVPSDIWIDHCTFTDGTCDDLWRNFNHDGAFDICGGKNITVSYCEFTNHDKVMLVAPGDKYTSTSERQITLHHNYFHHTTQRTPRSRGTLMHIYNNVYDDIGVPKNPGYVFGPGIASQYIVENNYIGSHLGTIVNYYDKSKLDEPTYSHLYATGNSREITEADVKWDGPEKTRDFKAHFTDKAPWKIPYKYDVSNWEAAKEDVLKNAGAGKNVEIKGLPETKKKK